MRGYPVITVSSFRQVSLYLVVMVGRLVAGSRFSKRSAVRLYLKYMKKSYFPGLFNPCHVISFNSVGLVSYVSSKTSNNYQSKNRSRLTKNMREIL